MRIGMQFSVLPSSASLLSFTSGSGLILKKRVSKTDEQLAKPAENFFPSEQRRQSNDESNATFSFSASSYFQPYACGSIFFFVSP